MADRILFLTGRLARARLEAVLADAGDLGFEWSVVDVGVKVAALMTEAIIARRLKRPIDADRVMLPGRCRVDLERLARSFNVPFERGPDELKDLPAYFGGRGRTLDLSRHDMRIFAEIVDASALTVEQIVDRATAMRAAGADVIDVGCRPDTPFRHLEDAIRALRANGFAVSVDSAASDELRRGGAAGADFLLSLTEKTLDIAADTGAPPILDPVIDPIHFGFMASLGRYAELRRAMPEAEILMGTGNLTELTDADSAGVTAMLLGICSELNIRNLLVVQVSPHTRRTIEEHDAARRIMFAARADGGLPKDYGDALLALHERRPFPNTPREIAEFAKQVKDDNFRIEVAEDGIHVYNRNGHHVAQDAMSLYPELGVAADGAHAFSLGAELMKAEIAWRLGKRYAQDAPLAWGCAVDRPSEDMARPSAGGPTLRSARSGGVIACGAAIPSPSPQGVGEQAGNAAHGRPARSER